MVNTVWQKILSFFLVECYSNRQVVILAPSKAWLIIIFSSPKFGQARLTKSLMTSFPRFVVIKTSFIQSSKCNTTKQNRYKITISEAFYPQDFFSVGIKTNFHLSKCFDMSWVRYPWNASNMRKTRHCNKLLYRLLFISILWAS